MARMQFWVNTGALDQRVKDCEQKAQVMQSDISHFAYKHKSFSILLDGGNFATKIKHSS